MSETSEIKDLTDINFTSRDLIGYRFEILTSKLLDKHKWKYRSNPLKDIKEWKQYQRKGVDFDLVDFNIELESKSGYAKVFKSWILRDWIPRFSYHNETRIVIVKPTLKLSNQCLELLFNYGINVVYPDSISYLVKRGNKLIEANSTKNTVKNSSTKNSSAQNNGTKNSGSKNVNSKDGIENDGARTEEKTNGSTSRDYNLRGSETKEISFPEKEISPSLGKISTVSVKIRVFYNRLKTSILNLLSNLWNNRHGSVTLVDWIPIKLKNKNKTNRARSQKLFPCPFKIVVVCSHYPQFYLCSLLVVYDCVQKLLGLGYDEDRIYRYIKNYLFKGIWQYKNTHLIKCRCKPISFIDNEIVERRFRTTLSIFEPCKKYKCSTMIGKRMCPYLIAIEKTKIKLKQLNLSAFMNGDDQHEEEARS